MTGCFYFLGFKEVDQEEEDEGVDGWYDCHGQCEICVDYDFASQQCLDHGWVSANPDSDPKQVCFDSSGTFDDPDHVCQNKFFSNIIESYGPETLVLDCVYTNYPDAGPIHTSWNCDEPADGEGTYTSGTEALRATLLEVDASGSHATITVGNNSETVGVKGWIEVTESPFRLVQLRLSPTDDIVLGRKTLHGRHHDVRSGDGNPWQHEFHCVILLFRTRRVCDSMVGGECRWPSPRSRFLGWDARGMLAVGRWDRLHRS